MIDIAPLLEPVSADSPCGIDISVDPVFLGLDALIAGKPETQFSPGEEPDWKGVSDACLSLLAQSKNLRVAVTLCLALLRLEGAPGLRSGLNLLVELVSRYWPDLYPKLDPDDNNDPLERVNILSSLSTPLATFGDPMRFLQRVRQIPLARSKRMGTFSFADIAGDKRVLPGGEEKPPASQAEVVAALRDTGPEEIEATAQAISDSIAHARALDEFLMKTVGANRALDMAGLVNLLAEIKKSLVPYLPKTSELAQDGEPGAIAQAPGAEGGGGSGEIRSRGDVIRALEKICDYYTRAEPSSPLPFLLERAKRLVDMDFLQIIGELTPDVRAHLEAIVGFKPQASDGAPPESQN